jgi:tight adherence protein C
VRFAALAGGIALALLLVAASSSEAAPLNRWIFVGVTGILGYFLPGLVLAQKIKAKMREYRNGFPDFMDLMIVCSDAGMSMEAGVERVSKELQLTYPSLAENLQLVSLELRAGRSLDDALKALSDRLSLDEVRSFATLLQQSKELGTSLSGALRVFSDEMRHKRMSLAEEKAHALPAKMSVPVTVCILPVVLMIAIIPIIVQLTAMKH